MDRTLLQPIDLVSGPLVLLVLVLIGGLIYNRDARLHGRKFVQLFWWALAVRLVASLTRIIITEYIVPSWGIDTIQYFKLSGVIADLFFEDPSLAFELVFSSYEDYGLEAQRISTHYFWEKLRTSSIFRFGSFLHLITGGSYLAISWICTFLAFVGSWLIYKTFHRIYPQYSLLIGLAVLFLPTVAFYSTNLFKDPFCILGLGLLCEGAFYMKEKGISFVPALSVGVGALILGVVKAYILLAFIVAFAVFYFAALELPVQKGVPRKVAKAILVLLGIGLIVGAGVTFIAFTSGRYNLGYLTLRLQYLLAGDRGASTGSGYALPLISLSPIGLTYFIWSAFNVSLFRPYPWEVNGLGPLLLFLESFPTLILTMFILVRTAFVNFFVQIFRDPYLLFCFTFSFVFLVITGAFSPTFGALCRYKIPGFPFFVIVLVVITSRYFKHERNSPSSAQKTN